MDIQDSLNQLVEFLKANWVWVVVIILLIIALFWAIKRRKPKGTPVNRGKEEKKNFIERCKYNYPTETEKWLVRGDKVYGEIVAIRRSKIKGGNEEKDIEIIETVVKKPLFKGYKIILFPKKEVYITKIENIWEHTIEKEIEIKETTEYDNVHGFYYDRGIEPSMVEFIRENSIMRTDLSILSSIYWGKSQEQAIFDPERAERMAQKQMELQLEKEKRARIVTGQ